MKPNLLALFDEVKKPQEKKSFTSNTIRLKADGSYIFRLLPTPSAPVELKRLGIKVVRYNWKSTAPDGRLIYATSPKTAGKHEVDPIALLRGKLYNEGNAVLQKKIQRTEKYLVNAFVVKDSITPDNEGKVKQVELPKSIFDFIVKEIESTSPDAIGPAIYDTSPSGHDLQIEVGSKEIIQDNGRKVKVPNYEGGFSFSRRPRALPGVKEPDEIYDLIADPLESTLKIDSPEECSKLLKDHFQIGKAPKAAVPDEEEDEAEEEEFPAPDAASKDIVGKSASPDPDEEDDEAAERALMEKIKKRVK